MSEKISFRFSVDLRVDVSTAFTIYWSRYAFLLFSLYWYILHSEVYLLWLTLLYFFHWIWFQRLFCEQLFLKFDSLLQSNVRQTRRQPIQTVVNLPYTVYALIFVGLNFCIFADQQPSAKVSSRKNLDQSDIDRVCKTVESQTCKMVKNGGKPSIYCICFNFRGVKLSRFHMQLRTATKAIDYINATRIQRKQQINEIKE